MERMAVQWALLTPPLEIEIATAGLDADRPNAQLAVFVHKDNPVAAVTLDQIDAILSAERKRGGAPLIGWAGLGVTGALAGRAIQPYGPPVESIDALFIRREVMKDTRKWVPTYQVRAEAALVESVAADPAGFAIAPYHSRASGVRMVPVIGTDGLPVALTSATAIDRTYPLVRAVRVVVHKPKDGRIATEIADFLRFVLSPSGQRAIAAEGSYLPLTPALAAAQTKKLD
jgi:phosphate transport system substrate-binding protein